MKLKRYLIGIILVMVGVGVMGQAAVSSVTVTEGSGTYGIDSIITINVIFDENVIVTGTPQLALDTRTVDYSGLTSTALSSLEFKYTVQSSDVASDLNYTSTGALTLNSGTINTETGGAPADRTLPNPSSDIAANYNIVVDGVAPGVPVISDFTDDTGSSAADNNTSDPTPTFTGTAEAGSTVEIFVDGASDGTTIATGGNWTYEVGSLASGTYSITATATDLAGNASSATAGFSITIDLVAPGVPVISDFTDDTGISASDNNTSDQTPIFTGTAEAGSTVEIFVDGASDGTTTATGGNWTYAFGSLAAGTYSITATATDLAGNTSSATAGFSITIDLVAPGVPVISDFTDDTGISAADNNTSDPTPTFTGTAEAGSTVEIFVDGASDGTTIATGGNWTYEVGSLASGTYSITATATDLAGNASSATAGFSITIDLVAPGVPVISDFTDDTGSSDTDNNTSDPTPTFTGTAEAGSTVEIFVDGASDGTTIATGGNWTYAFGSLAAGTYSITATATDLAGNASSATAGFSITIDLVAPGVPVISDFTDDTGSSDTDNNTSDQTPIFTGTAEAGSTVEIFVDGASDGTTTATGGNWTYAFGSLAAGTYSITATATDLAGNTSSATAGFSITIDLVAPGIPVISDFTDDTGSSDTDNNTSDPTPTFTGTAEAGSTVEIFVDGASDGTTIATGGNWTYEVGSLASGTYSITATATDLAGNASSATAGFSITIDLVAPGVPVISDFTDDTGISASDNNTSDQTPIFTGTAEAGSTVEIFVDGASDGTTTATGGNWTYAFGSLAAGTYSITATATDLAGNTSSATAGFSITIDLVAPGVPVISDFTDDTGISAADNNTSDPTPTFTGTAEAGSTVEIFVDGASDGTTIATGGNWTYEVGSLASGTYSITATATDLAGNASSATAGFSITIDLVAPGVPVISDFTDDTGSSDTDNNTSDPTPTFTGTAEAGSTVEIFVDGASDGTTIATGGNWTYAFGSLAAGTYSITATATDLAGNTSSATAGFSITIDLVAPGVPVISDFTDDTGISASDNNTSDQTPTFTGTAEAGSTVEIFVDGASDGTTTATGGNWTYAFGSLAAGTYSITATATDLAGNTSSATAGFSLTIDLVAPGIPVISDFTDDTGSSDTDNNTSDPTPTFTGTAEAGSTVEIFVDGASDGTTIATGGNWTYEVGSLASGTYSITATATDLAGNASSATAGFSITIDLVAPGVPVISDFTDDTGISASDNNTSDPTPIFTGTAEAESTVEIFVDGASDGTTTATGGNWTYAFGSLAAGTYSITATATDLAGNTSSATAGFSITIDLVAPGVPVISDFTDDTGISAADNNTSDPTPTFTGTAEAGSTVEIFVDGASDGTTIATGGNWTYAFGSLAAGTYSITATATDLAGNTSSATAGFSITIDLVAPGVPVISDFTDDTGISAADNNTSDPTPTFTGTAEAGSTVEIFVDGASDGTTIATGGNWTYEVGSLASGTYSITATATDLAGNASSATAGFSITIDLVAPGVPVISDFTDDTGSSDTDNNTSDPTPTFTGTAEAGSTVEIFVDGASDGTTIATGGNWTYEVGSLASGTYSITATATDIAGNTSSATAGFSITIDLVAPAAPTSLNLDSGSDTGIDPSDDETNDTTPTFDGLAEANSTVLLISSISGALGNTTTNGGGVWTFTAPPLVAGTHLITAKATDAAGNESSVSSSLPIEMDLTAPNVTSISYNTPSAALTNATLLIYTVTFSEPVSGIDVSDYNLTLSGVTGTIASVSAASGTVIDVTIDPVDSDGTLRLNLNGSGTGITDIAGNPISGAFTGGDVYTIDQTSPTLNSVTIASDNLLHPSYVGIGGKVTLTFTGSEGLASNPVVTINNHTAEVSVAQINSSDINWTASYVMGTASDPTSQTIPFNIDFEDFAGNAVTGTNTITGGGSVEFDKDAAILTNNPHILSNNTDTTQARPGDVVTLTFATAEKVENVVAKIETKLMVATSPDSLSWTAEYTMPSTGITPGVLPYTITFKDFAGNASSPNPLKNINGDGTFVNFDPTAPDPPTNLILIDDVGLSLTDSITSITKPELQCTAVTGLSVVFYSNRVAGNIGTATETGAGSGIYSLTPATDLANGVHIITATATDAAGNISTLSPSSLPITIDSSKPLKPGTPDLDPGSDTGNSNIDNITSNTTPTIGGTAEKNTRIYIYRSGSIIPLGTADVDNFGNWSKDVSLPADGTYSIYVKAVDLAGNENVSNSDFLLITLDTTNPSTPLPTSFGLDGSSDTGRSNSDNNTSDDTPGFSGLAGSVENGSMVTLYSDGNSVGSGYSNASGSWSITSNILSEGNHNITITATDTAGNISGYSNKLGITVDKTAPAKPGTPDLDPDFDSGSSTIDNKTNDTIPVFFGEANVEPYSRVKLYSDVVGTDSIGWVFADSNGDWSITANTTLPGGIHSISITATDSSGNVSPVSNALVITIDLNIPDAPEDLDLNSGSDTGSSSVDNNTSNNELVISGTAEAGSAIELFSGGTSIGTGTASGTGQWSITSDVLSEGKHSITATATDAVLNVSGPSVALNVTVDWTKPDAPGKPDLDDASDTGFSNTDNYTSDDTPMFTGTAEPGSMVRIYADGILKGSGVAAGGSYSITTNALTEGKYKIAATATDTAGNISDLSDLMTIIIDLINPPKPGLLYLDPLSDNGLQTDNITNDTTPKIMGTAEDGSYVKIYNEDVLTDSVIAVGGSYDYTFGTLSDGTYSIYVIATDSAGNSSIPSNILEIEIDNTNPDLSGIQIASNNEKPHLAKIGDIVSLSFTSTENIQIPTVEIDGQTLSATGGPTVWTAAYTMLGTENQGLLSFEIQYIDIAGNPGDIEYTTTDASEVIFDTVAPDINTINIASDHSNDYMARSGSEISLSFTSTDSIEDISVNINTKFANVTNVGTNNWKATRTLSSTDPVGSVSFTINYKDLAGNPGPQKIETTDASNVSFDNTDPLFDTVFIYSSNANKDFATVGDLITLEFVTNEAVETPVVDINGIPPTITGGPTDWVATRTAISGDDEGIVQFSIDISDKAGNIAPTRLVADASTVTFDKSVPVITSITVPSGVYKVGDNIRVLIETDGAPYVATTVQVNGKNQDLTKNSNSIYYIDYLVAEGDDELATSNSLPVDIVLKDSAGLTSSLSDATTTGTISIDANTPRIATFTSTAETSGNLIIGDNIMFTLTPFSTEMGLLVEPVEYNGTVLNWTTVNGSVYQATYTVKEGDPQQLTPLQTDLVVLADSAGNADTLSYTAIAKHIYTKYPTVKITGTTTKCDYGTTVPITFQFTGTKPFSLTYNNGTADVGPIPVDALFYSTLEERGTFKLVNLTDATGNFITSAPDSAKITVNPRPEISTDYTKSPYNIESDPDELSQYVMPADHRTGIFSAQEGISYSGDKYYFNPGNVPPTLLDKEMRIIYSYTDAVTGCSNSDTNTVYVSSTPVSIVGLASVYCEDAEVDTVSGRLPVQHTGEFEVLDADLNPVSSGWMQLDSITVRIDPTQFTPGTYTLKYTALTYPDSVVTEFANSKEFKIEAIRTGMQIVGLSDEYCFDDVADPIKVEIDFEPATGDIGTFSGPSSVFTITPGSHSSTFRLAAAVASTSYTLNYVYESAAGCVADPISQTVHINPLPVLSFNMKDNYNYEEGEITLEGTPSGSTYKFAGDGISVTNDKIFNTKKTSKIGSEIVIYYSGSDANGCENEFTDTTFVYRATEPIQGIKASGIYCYDDVVLDIACTPDVVRASNGTFRSMNNGLLPPDGTNKAKYSLKDAGSGQDTIYFDYEIAGTAYTVKKGVYIDSIGDVTITSTSQFGFDLCDSDPLVILNGVQNYTDGGQGVFTYYGSAGTPVVTNSSSIGIDVAEVPGEYLVEYVFNSTKGCDSKTSEYVTIYPEPKVDFTDLATKCPDITTPVPFVDLTTYTGSDPVTWEWSVAGSFASSEQNPTITFKSNNITPVELKVSPTASRCASAITKQYTIGQLAIANFELINNCNIGDSVSLSSTSIGGVLSEGKYKWKIGDTFLDDTTANPKIKFDNIGYYDVSLDFTSTDGCTDSKTKTLKIQPYIKFQEPVTDTAYYEDFESDDDFYNWDAKSLSENDPEPHWKLGMPDGDVINTAASGSSSWFTDFIDKPDVENSQVVSPCFDLSGLEKPMIKMNIWSSSELKRDGAVLQYSVDFGENWVNLQDVVSNPGPDEDLKLSYNWFNSENIQSQPAEQFNGWNHENMFDWTSARHNLDKLKGNKAVRFRIAYAADGQGTNNVDGFAFDDVWIGERQQKVLSEYFTNIKEQTNAVSEGNAYISSFEAEKTADLIPIHYHTGSPSGDLLYNNYPEGPSSRVFYYGVSRLPYVFINGIVSSPLSDIPSFEVANDSITLQDPKVSIDMNVASNNVNIIVTALNDLSGENLVVYAALVKKSVTVKDVSYPNVLRKFLPDPGGVILQTADFTSGQTIEEQIAIDLAAPECKGSNLVVFVQNRKTKQVYQTASVDLSTITSVKPEGVANMVDVYPNPAIDYLFIDSDLDIQKLYVIDIAGKILSIMEPNQKRISIPIGDFNYGLYFIKGQTREGEFVKKFVKQ